MHPFYYYLTYLIGFLVDSQQSPLPSWEGKTTPLREARIYNRHMTKFDPQKHHHRSFRLKGFDYSSAGTYYVTIVAWRRECLFWEVVNKEMKLSRYGEIVHKRWDEIPNHFPNVETGAFVVMPKTLAKERI